MDRKLSNRMAKTDSGARSRLDLEQPESGTENPNHHLSN